VEINFDLLHVSRLACVSAGQNWSSSEADLVSISDNKFSLHPLALVVLVLVLILVSVPRHGSVRSLSLFSRVFIILRIIVLVVGVGVNSPRHGPSGLVEPLVSLLLDLLDILLIEVLSLESRGDSVEDFVHESLSLRISVRLSLVVIFVGIVFLRRVSIIVVVLLVLVLVLSSFLSSLLSLVRIFRRIFLGVVFLVPSVVVVVVIVILILFSLSSLIVSLVLVFSRPFEGNLGFLSFSGFELDVDFSGAELRVSEDFNSSGDESVLLDLLFDGLSVSDLVLSLNGDLGSNGDVGVSKSLLRLHGVEVLGSDSLSSFEPVSVGRVGKLNSRDEGLGLSLVVDDVVVNLGFSLDGPLLLLSVVVDSDVDGERGLSGLLDVSSDSSSLLRNNSEHESVRRVEDLRFDVGDSLESSDFSGLGLLLVDLSLVNLERQDNGVLVGNDNWKSQFGGNDLLERGWHEDLAESSRVSLSQLLGPRFNGLLSLVNEFEHGVLIHGVERGSFEQFDEEVNLRRFRLVLGGGRQSLSELLDSFLSGDLVLELAVRSRSVFSVFEDRFKESVSSNDSSSNLLESLSFESDFEELFMERSSRLEEREVGSLGDWRPLGLNDFSGSPESEVLLFVIVVLGRVLGVSRGSLRFRGGGSGFTGSLGNSLHARSSVVSNRLESRSNIVDNVLILLLVEVGSNGLKNMSLRLREHKDGESSQSSLVGFVVVSVDGEDDGEDLLRVPLGDMSQSVDGNSSDEGSFLHEVLSFLNFVSGERVEVGRSRNIGFKSGKSFRNSHMSEGLKSGNLLGEGVGFFQVSLGNNNVSLNIFLGQGLLGEQVIPLLSLFLLVSLLFSLLFSLELVLFLFSQRLSVLVGNVSRGGLGLVVSLVNELSETDGGSSVSLGSVSNSGVLSELKESINGLNVGEVHVLGESFKKLDSLEGADSVFNDQVSNVESSLIGSRESEGIEVHLSGELLLGRGVLVSSLLGGFSEELLEILLLESGKAVDDLDNLLHGILGFGVRLVGEDLSGKGIEDSGQLLLQFFGVGPSVDSHVGDVKLVVGSLRRSRILRRQRHLGESESQFLVLLGVLDGVNSGSSSNLGESHVLLSDGHDVSTESRVDNSSLRSNSFNGGVRSSH